MSTGPTNCARRPRPYLPRILAHCRWPLGTNLVKGINNKMKVIKRMAYGFRDDADFFLKIRAAPVRCRELLSLTDRLAPTAQPYYGFPRLWELSDFPRIAP